MRAERPTGRLLAYRRLDLHAHRPKSMTRAATAPHGVPQEGRRLIGPCSHLARPAYEVDGHKFTLCAGGRSRSNPSDSSDAPASGGRNPAGRWDCAYCRRNQEDCIHDFETFTLFGVYFSGTANVRIRPVAGPLGCVKAGRQAPKPPLGLPPVQYPEATTLLGRERRTGKALCTVDKRLSADSTLSCASLPRSRGSV